MRYFWNPKIACRVLEGTAFVLLDSHMVSLNDVGTRIWELFEHGGEIDEVADRIASEFDVGAAQAVADAQPFVESLVQRGLLIEQDGQRATGSSRVES